MLFDSREYRRRRDDDADYQHSLHSEYVKRKNALPPMEQEEYEQACIKIASELGI